MRSIFMGILKFKYIIETFDQYRTLRTKKMDPPRGRSKIHHNEITSE
jgi:hypothetical protein